MYIVCPRRKGFPRIDVKVCRFCKDEKCPERKKLPRIRVSKPGPVGK